MTEIEIYAKCLARGMTLAGAAGTQAYIIGTPNTTINGLQLRFWYEVGV